LRDFWHLRDVDWLSELSPEERGSLRSLGREYSPGETIFAPDPRPQLVYLLERGLVRIFRLSDSGEEATFGYVKPGEVFGELAIFSDRPRESFAQAVRPSWVWQVEGEALRRILAGHAGIAIEVTKQVGARFKRIESRVENLVFRDVCSRLGSLLLELAEDHGSPDAGRLRIALPLTQAELAKLVGTTRQSVSGCLRELEAEGLLAREGRTLVLLEPARLRRVLSPSSIED